MGKKLYNLIFPLWMLLLVPKFWMIALPAVFVLNTIVFFVAMKAFKEENIVENYKKSILKLWLFNFVGVIVSSIILLGIQMLPTTNEWLGSIVTALAYNPFHHIVAIIVTILAIVLSGYIVYRLNMKMTLKDLKIKNKQKIAFVIAIVTAPYLFFYPAEKIYQTSNIGNEGNARAIPSEFSGDTITTRIFAESQNYTNTEFKYIDKIAKVDSDIIESSKGSIVNMKISTKFDENADRQEYEKWAKQCSIIVFIKQPNIDEVVVNLSSDTKEVCHLTFLKEDIEREYQVLIAELENNAVKLQSILDSIVK